MFLNERQKEWLWEFWHGHERLYKEEAEIIIKARTNPDLQMFSDDSIQRLIKHKIRAMYKRRFPNARKVQIPLPKKHSDAEDGTATYGMRSQWPREQVIERNRTESQDAMRSSLPPEPYAIPHGIPMRPDFEGLFAKALEDAYLSGALSMVQGIKAGRVPDYRSESKEHAQESITFLKGGAWQF